MFKTTLLRRRKDARPTLFFYGTLLYRCVSRLPPVFLNRSCSQGDRKSCVCPVCVPAPPGVFLPEGGSRRPGAGCQRACSMLSWRRTHDPIPGTVQTDSTLVSCSNSEGEDVYA